jgi:hypothetical protein
VRAAALLGCRAAISVLKKTLYSPGFTARGGDALNLCEARLAAPAPLNSRTKYTPFTFEVTKEVYNTQIIDFYYFTSRSRGIY